MVRFVSSVLWLEHVLGNAHVDAGKSPGGFGLLKAAVGVDRGGGVGDDMGIEPFASCIDCGERDAVVKRKTANPDVGDAALAQITR